MLYIVFSNSGRKIIKKAIDAPKELIPAEDPDNDWHPRNAYFSCIVILRNHWKSTIRTAKTSVSPTECYFSCMILVVLRKTLKKQYTCNKNERVTHGMRIVLYYVGNFEKIIAKALYVEQKSIAHGWRQTSGMKFPSNCTLF